MPGRESKASQGAGDLRAAENSPGSQFLERLCTGTTLQAAEKLIAAAIPLGFVKGHDFSQADKAHQIDVGLQPLRKPIVELPSSRAFFRILFSRAANGLERRRKGASSPVP
jgi:hypothetical protein